MFKKLLAGVATIALSLGMVAFTAGPASAAADPTHSVSADCEAVDVDLKHYEDDTYVTVSYDGAVADATFDNNFNQSYAFASEAATHTYRVTVTAPSGVGNYDTGELSVTDCLPDEPIPTPSTSPTPIVGVEGTLVEVTPERNNPDYWGANCFKFEGATIDDSPYGYLTNGGLTVTLNEGFDFTLLIVKGGNLWNNVITDPVPGTAYASTVNNGGQQAAVSHWIVCLGTSIPQDAAAAVTIVPPSCDAAGSATIGTVTFATWDGVLDTSVGTHSETFTAVDGHLFGNGTTTLVVEYTVAAKLEGRECLELVTLSGDPTHEDATCDVLLGVVNGSIWVERKEGLEYTITDVTDAPFLVATLTGPGDGTTSLPPGDYHVTLTALPGYVLDLQDPATAGPWDYTILAPEGECDPTTLDTWAVNAAKTDQSCSANGTIAGTIIVGAGVLGGPFLDEVNYYIDGNLVTQAVTAVAAGTYTVTAEPIDDADGLTGYPEGGWELTVAGTSGVCDLTTLALTGAGDNAAGWAGLGYYLLVAGLALIAVRTLRRRNEVKQ